VFSHLNRLIPLLLIFPPPSLSLLLTMSIYLGMTAAAAAGYYAITTKMSQISPLVDPRSQTTVLPDGSRVAANICGSPKAEYLYEDARTVYEAFARGRKMSGDRPMLGMRGGTADAPTDYSWITYNEFWKNGHWLAAGLMSLGLKQSTETIIGIFSKNRPEWIITELGTFANGMVNSPLYETLGLIETIYVCKLTTMPLVIVDSPSKAQLLLKHKTDLPDLKHIVVIDAKDLKSIESIATPLKVSIHSFSSLIEKGKTMKDFKPKFPQPDDLATICFTSGTTSMPKGVMLTHKNIISDTTTLLNVSTMRMIDNDDVMMSFLPLAHMFERVMEITLFSSGGAIGYFRGDIKGLADDIKTLRPTVFPVVPRVLNKIYDKIWAEASKSTVKSMLLSSAVAFKELEMKRFVVRNDSLVDTVVFKKIRDSLGGRVRLMVTGSAPLSTTVLTFMRAALGCVLVEGYGQTECVAGATLTIAGDSNPGHVGIPVPAIQIKLEDIPDMDYKADKNGGEVCIKGATVFTGYYKNAEETGKALDGEGWLHTGDIGRWTTEGTLKIVDRKKHIFKLSQGEYVAPEKVENVYVTSKFVGQVFVHGDSLKTCVIAIVVPDAEVLLPHAKSIGMKGTLEELCKDAKIKKMIMDDMIAEGKKAKLNSIEQVKDIFLSHELFTIENDLLTPTMKSKRPNIKKRYTKELADLYSRLE
ncbi:hypothetical protein PRIPAC_80132, partial [Pristionchus pacificus]